MTSYYFPTKIELQEAIIKALESEGGISTTVQINKKVIELLQLSKEVVEEEDESGIGTRYEYRMRWCRTELRAAGKIENVKRGTWRLKVTP